MFYLRTQKGTEIEIDPENVEGFEIELEGQRYEITITKK